jgi:hypothetical protein
MRTYVYWFADRPTLDFYLQPMNVKDPTKCVCVCVCVCVSLSVIRCNNNRLHLEWVGGRSKVKKDGKNSKENEVAYAELQRTSKCSTEGATQSHIHISGHGLNNETVQLLWNSVFLTNVAILSTRYAKLFY